MDYIHIHLSGDELLITNSRGDIYTAHTNTLLSNMYNTFNYHWDNPLTNPINLNNLKQYNFADSLRYPYTFTGLIILKSDNIIFNEIKQLFIVMNNSIRMVIPKKCDENYDNYYINHHQFHQSFLLLMSKYFNCIDYNEYGIKYEQYIKFTEDILNQVNIENRFSNEYLVRRNMLISLCALEKRYIGRGFLARLKGIAKKIRKNNINITQYVDIISNNFSEKLINELKRILIILELS